MIVIYKKGIKQAKEFNKIIKNMNIECIYVAKDYSIIDERIETKVNFLIYSIILIFGGIGLAAIPIGLFSEFKKSKKA